jgi:hypothetical protein
VNVIEEIQERCNFIREICIPAYENIGPAGALGKILLQQEIKTAENVIAGGDVVQMITTLKALQETCERSL